MNTEKVYIEFLCSYISIAFRLGYLLDGYRYVMKLECQKMNESERNSGELKDVLAEVCDVIEKKLRKNIPPISAKEEFEQVLNFFSYNIKIIEFSKKVQCRRLNFESNISEIKKYRNKSEYLKLKKLIEDKECDIKEILDQKYEKKNISLLEHQELYQIHLKSLERRKE